MNLRSFNTAYSPFHYYYNSSNAQISIFQVEKPISKSDFPLLFLNWHFRIICANDYHIFLPNLSIFFSRWKAMMILISFYFIGYTFCSCLALDEGMWFNVNFYGGICCLDYCHIVGANDWNLIIKLIIDEVK